MSKPLGYFTSSPAIETFLQKHSLNEIDKAFMLFALSEFVFQKVRGSEIHFADTIPDVFWTLPFNSKFAPDIRSQDHFSAWENTFGELSEITSEQALGFIAYLSQS